MLLILLFVYSFLYTLIFPKGHFKSIDDDVFLHTEKIAGLNLEQVIIPPTIESIGNRCFSGCSNLKRFFLPDNILELGESCLKSCRHLIEVHLSKNINLMDVLS